MWWAFLKALFCFAAAAGPLVEEYPYCPACGVYAELVLIKIEKDIFTYKCPCCNRQYRERYNVVESDAKISV